MSPQAEARPKRWVAGANRKKKKPRVAGRGVMARSDWIRWWPLVAGIAITLAAVKTAEILPLMGAEGLFRLRLLYPFALLLKQPQLGLSEAASDRWSQIMLYAQFPLYGLYASLMARWKPLWRVWMQVAAIHLLGFAVLWLLAAQ